MKSARSKWGIVLAQIVVLAVVLYFIGRMIAKLWPEMRELKWHFTPTTIAEIVALGVAYQACLVVGWRLALAATGAEISWIGAAQSQIIGALARYVPGKVLTIVGKGYLASRAGIPVSRATLAMFIEAAAMTTTSLAVGSAYIVVVVPDQQHLLPLAGIAILGCLIVMHPRVLPWILNAIFVRIGREPVELRYRLPAIAKLVGCYLVLWCVTGLALHVMGRGLGVSLSWVALAAGFALSWAIAFLSFIFPAGIGLREVVLAKLLGPAADAGVAMGIALASRAWILAAELACALAVWIVGRWLRNRPEDIEADIEED